jgi:uncharacterized membrane-anchored protein
MRPDASNEEHAYLTKVPAVTLGFWIIKILATTFGETAGDTLSMSFDLGYMLSSLVFAAILFLLVAAQIRARRFHPFLYWATIVASTTAGTTMADFATRSLGIGYAGGAALLLAALLLSLAAWHLRLGSISIATVRTAPAEIFYWVTITVSQTLGTALGDWLADSGLGYMGAGLVFAGLLAAIVLAYYRGRMSHVLLFWAAFVLTRPLGAALGDFIDKPLADGGLALSRAAASSALAIAMITLILALPQRAGEAH